MLKKIPAILPCLLKIGILQMLLRELYWMRNTNIFKKMERSFFGDIDMWEDLCFNQQRMIT